MKIKPIPINGFKKYVALFVLLFTAFLFAYYIAKNPQLLTSVKNTSIVTILILLLAYSGGVLTNAAILFWSIQICNRTINRFEALLLTGYSSLVNFFGPLQSGPGFRAIYLKRKYGLSIKSYGVATLIYYGAFGIISLVMVGYGLQPKLALSALLILLIGIIIGSIYIKNNYSELVKHPIQISKIFAMTFFQILITTLLYYVELKTVNKNISLSQAFIYTGAANLSLYVALTPGAIGFRETFLLFSQRLHHIDTHDILAANVIDRAVYFIFLGLLFAITASFHFKEKYSVKN